MYICSQKPNIITQDEKDNLFELIALLACVCCVTKPNTGSNQEGASEEITKTFEEYGFSITAPCVLKENPPVNDLWNDAYYKTIYSDGAVESPDDPNKITLYLVGVREMPRVFEDLSEDEQNEQLDLIKNADFPDSPSATNVEKVLFSDKKYPGYVGDRNFGETIGRIVTFSKGKYIISLSVMADTSAMKQDVLTQKFNEFTNSFKVIE